MRRIALHLLLVLQVFVGTAFSSVVLLRFEARTEGSVVVVTFQPQSGTEDNVTRYILQRKAEFQPRFETVREFELVGSGSIYEYRDDGLYKMAANEVEYRLLIRYGNGRIMAYDQTVRADYTSTAARRTWGSIKAMFQ